MMMAAMISPIDYQNVVWEVVLLLTTSGLWKLTHLERRSGLSSGVVNFTFLSIMAVIFYALLLEFVTP